MFIEDLEVFTVIGVHDWERQAKRPLLISLEMQSDNARAAATDAISDALDYHAVSCALQSLADSTEYALIETFAERAAEQLQQKFAIGWLKLTVRKPGAIAAARAVGVCIERGGPNT